MNVKERREIEMMDFLRKNRLWEELPETDFNGFAKEPMSEKGEAFVKEIKQKFYSPSTYLRDVAYSVGRKVKKIKKREEK